MSFFTKAVALGIVVVSLSACSAVTVRPNGGMKNSSSPTYSESQNYFLFGLAGEHTVNLSKVCPAGNATQMQSVQSFSDGFLTAITFGLYAPHTANVWCGE